MRPRILNYPNDWTLRHPIIETYDGNTNPCGLIREARLYYTRHPSVCVAISAQIEVSMRHSWDWNGDLVKPRRLAGGGERLTWGWAVTKISIIPSNSFDGDCLPYDAAKLVEDATAWLITLRAMYPEGGLVKFPNSFIRRRERAAARAAAKEALNGTR